MRWLDRIERQLKWLRIPNLMNIMVVGMALVWLVNMVMPGLNLTGLLSLERTMLLRGQVWRLVTFVFLPPSGSMLTLILGLYFYWLIGNALAHEWGDRHFTLFYLVGVLGQIVAALVTGYASNTFLNMSLFFAFAAMWPDYQILLFFILPVKMKYLALLNAAFYLWQLIVGSWSTRLTILLSLLNIILFLGPDLLSLIRRETSYWKTRRRFRQGTRR